MNTKNIIKWGSLALVTLATLIYFEKLNLGTQHKLLRKINKHLFMIPVASYAALFGITWNKR